MADQTESKLQKEATARLAAARVWKQRRLLDFKECYFFAAPSRQRQLSSQTAPSTQTMLDEPELNTDLAFLLVGDFVTEIVNTYMPEAQQWCERAAGMDVPQEVFNSVKDQVKADDAKIFSAIKASNLYSELPKALNPDLAIAGAGLWITRPSAHHPITVLSVPMREIEINIGPDGQIDDRFVVRYTRNEYVHAVVGDEVWDKLDADKRKAIEDKPDGHTDVCWGFWRLWLKLDDEWWQHVVMVGGKVFHIAEMSGEGCCPFNVMRFGATADWPWAIGPLLQGLPTLRQVDELSRILPEAVERATNPPVKYPDDSAASVEQGIEPGMGYPVRPGSGEDFGALYQQPPIDPAYFELEKMERRLKKLFFVDYPEQTGDTPPTLGQWLDEMARAQRRIGTPGQSFWREGPMNIFLRFKYLLEKAGTIKALADKSGRAISTQPYNPAQRAAEQQEIATAAQCAQLLAQMFPEEWRISMDGGKTMDAMIDKMRTGGLLKRRSPDDIKAAVAQIAQLAGTGGLRQHAGAPVPEGAGAPAAT